MADFSDFSGSIGDFGGDPTSPISSFTPTPTPAMDPTAASGGGGGFGGFASAVGDVAKSAAPFLGAGTGLMGVAQGIMGARALAQQSNIATGAARQQSDLSKQAAGVAGPLGQFSAQELALAGQGKIPPAIQATIDQWRTAARQQAMDHAARSGQGSSQALASWLSWIDQQAKSMVASALESEQGLGIQSGGVAGNVLANAAGAAHGAGQTAGQQQGGLEALIGAANQVLARLTASAG